jgi:hypothetical protein
MALPFLESLADFCYVSVVLKVDSKSVISFFNKGKLISLGLPFLQFCKKYDICIQHEQTFCFGKMP